jgi:hypothetical protein
VMTGRINLLGIGMPMLAFCALAACSSDDSNGNEAQGDAASDAAAPQVDSGDDASTPTPDAASDVSTIHDAGSDGSATPDAEVDATTAEDAGIDATLSGSDGSTPDGSTPDGSTPDGSTPDGSTPDGSPGENLDAGPDAADVAADVVDAGEPGTVQVLVLASGAAEQGVTVVFSDATGALITTGVTDAQGSVVQAIAAGGQVTALLATKDAPSLVTVTGVEPGDVLKFHDGPFPDLQGTAEVTFKGLPQADASLTDYNVMSGVCGYDSQVGPGTFDYPMTGNCMNAEGQFPVLAEASGTTVGLIAWESGKGTLNADPMGVSKVDLSSASWSTTYGSETVTLLDVPDAAYPPWTTVFEDATADSLSSVGYFSSSTTSTSLDGGVQSIFPLHPGLGDFDQVEVDIQTVETNGLSTIAIADRVNATTQASPSATDTIDYNDALPAFTGETVDATNPLRPTFAWTSGAPLSAAAALIVSAQWSDPSDDAGDLRYGTWTVIVPPGQASVVLPQIPSAPGFGPVAGTSWYEGGYAIAAVNGDPYPNYDSIRAAAAIFGPLMFSPSTTTATLPTLPANGRARLSEYLSF